MSYKKLLDQFIKQTEEERQLAEQLISATRARMRTEKRLKRVLGAEVMPAVKAESKAPPPGGLPSLEVICVNCGQTTPRDAVRCVHCEKRWDRKE